MVKMHQIYYMTNHDECMYLRKLQNLKTIHGYLVLFSNFVHLHNFVSRKEWNHYTDVQYQAQMLLKVQIYMTVHHKLSVHVTSVSILEQTII